MKTADKHLGTTKSFLFSLLLGSAALLLSFEPAMAQGSTAPAQRSFWGMVLWPILGLIAGVLGRVVLNKIRESAFLDIILGIVGACIIGGVVEYFGPHTGGLEAWPMAAAFLGGLAVVAVYHGAAKDESGR